MYVITIMKYLLFLLLLATPAHATTTDPVEELTGDDICAVVAAELRQAVEFGLINEKESADIALRCWINYS